MPSADAALNAAADQQNQTEKARELMTCRIQRKISDAIMNHRSIIADIR